MRDEELRWFTSSFSGGNGNGCVEVAFLPAGIAVRDTKDRTLAPHRYPAASWSQFLAGVRAGEFDEPRPEPARAVPGGANGTPARPATRRRFVDTPPAQ